MDAQNASTDLASDLEGARRVIEGNFLAAGEILTQSIAGVDALIASLEKLVQALDAKAVDASTRDMRVAAETLNGLADNHRNRQNAIEQLGRHRESLAKCVGDMRSSLAYMRAFTVNIKIVSSGIAEAGSTFESFAQEISDCIESGRDQLRGLEEEITSLQEGLSDALHEGFRLASQIGKLLPALPNALAETAVAMADHYNRVHALAGEVAGLARNIHKRVVRVLQALQIGDITRQRVEHIQSAIETVALLQDEDGRLTALCHALLRDQLESTLAEFHREVVEIEHAMNDMAAHSRELLKVRDMAYGNGGEGVLNDLATRLEDALVLVDEIEGADTSALKTGQETATAAEKLGDRIAAIQSLKNDVQYMALNTTIKCAQIGEAARPLSVIALELRDHGRHLEDAAAEGLGEIDKLTAAAASLTLDGDAKGLSATDALRVAAKLIRDARQRTEREIDVLVSKGEEVLGVLDNAVTRLNFREAIGGRLKQVEDDLNDLTKAVSLDPSGLETKLSELFDGFHQSYTMAQERVVQQAFMDQIGLASREAAA